MDESRAARPHIAATLDHRHLVPPTLRHLSEHPGLASLLDAEVPLAEMFGYATAIRSLSKGRAAYHMEPFRFEPVPNSIVANLLDSAKPKPAPRA